MGKGEETGKNRKLGDGQKGGERGYGEGRMIGRLGGTLFQDTIMF